MKSYLLYLSESESEHIEKPLTLPKEIIKPAKTKDFPLKITKVLSMESLNVVMDNLSLEYELKRRKKYCNAQLKKIIDIINYLQFQIHSPEIFNLTKDIEKVALKYISYSIASLKNGKCELLNSEIEGIDECLFQTINSSSLDLLFSKKITHLVSYLKYFIAITARLIHYISLVDLSCEEMIHKKKKLLINAFENTTIQFALRRKNYLKISENLFEQKQKNLRNFMKNKLMKWKNQKKEKEREKEEQKKEKEEFYKKVVCRICGKKILKGNFKKHSDLCKETEEIKKEGKQINQDLNKLYIECEKNKKHYHHKILMANQKIDKSRKNSNVSNSPRIEIFDEKNVSLSDYDREKPKLSTNFLTPGLKKSNFSNFYRAKTNANDLSQFCGKFMDDDKSGDEENKKSDEGEISPHLLATPKRKERGSKVSFLEDSIVLEPEQEKIEEEPFVPKLLQLNSLNFGGFALKKVNTNTGLGLDRQISGFSGDGGLISTHELKLQIKFYSDAVLVFSLIADIYKALVEETKLPNNLTFWFNEQKKNLEFIMKKVDESDISIELTQKAIDITNLADDFIKMSQKKIDILKRIKKNQNTMQIQEIQMNEMSPSPLSKKHSKKSITKFSVSNENEFLSMRISNQPLKPQPIKIQIKKFNEYRSKSEEKYKGGPGYQVFIAQTLCLQVSCKSPAKKQVQQSIMNFADHKVSMEEFSSSRSRDKGSLLERQPPQLQRLLPLKTEDLWISTEDKPSSPLKDSLHDIDEDKADAISKSSSDSQTSNIKPGYLSDENESNAKNIRRNTASIGIADFNFIKLISKGAFGRVWLVQRKLTDDLYAMKIINFAEKMGKNQLDSLKKEQQVFGVVNGDYVVKAIFSFIHETFLCIVMEYMRGGDLGSLLEESGCFEEDTARFYIAEIILALESLHTLDIVHRDIKPDNILLDIGGHVKLSDFGLSEFGVAQRFTNSKSSFSVNNERRRNSQLIFEYFPQVVYPNPKPSLNKSPSILPDFSLPLLTSKSSLHRIIGTPDYVAPEIIKGTDYNNPGADFWSLGVMLFEFLTGIPPFNDDTVEKIFDNIKEMRIPWDGITIGDNEGEMSPLAEDLIRKLLEPEPEKRIRVSDIKNHLFFKGIEWGKLRERNAPIKPDIKSEYDISRFEGKKNVYEEKEKDEPFFSKDKKSDNLLNEAKEILGRTDFKMTRIDILYEENKRLFMERSRVLSRSRNKGGKKFSVFEKIEDK